MEEQSHIVSGIYTSRAEAEVVRDRLAERGLPAGQMYIEAPAGELDGGDAIVQSAGAEPVGQRRMAADNDALKEMVVDGGVGAAVGGGLGLLAEVALVAANVTLFVASPLIAPLAMLGWGAALGGVVGAAVGAESTESTHSPAEKKEGMFSELVLDAIKSGHVVLVANTWTEGELALVREVIGDSVAPAAAAA